MAREWTGTLSGCMCSYLPPNLIHTRFDEMEGFIARYGPEAVNFIVPHKVAN